MTLGKSDPCLASVSPSIQSEGYAGIHPQPLPHPLPCPALCPGRLAPEGCTTQTRHPGWLASGCWRTEGRGVGIFLPSLGLISGSSSAPAQRHLLWGGPCYASSSQRTTVAQSPSPTHCLPRAVASGSLSALPAPPSSVQAPHQLHLSWILFPALTSSNPGAPTMQPV